MDNNIKEGGVAMVASIGDDGWMKLLYLRRADTRLLISRSPSRYAIKLLAKVLRGSA